MPTKIIDNFFGGLTRQNIGDMNSGLAKYNVTFGNNPFVNPTNLTWFEEPVLIENVITDVIMAARPRLENGITYVYAIGDTGKLYKIQVNDPSNNNPNYDNPVLLTTLVAQSPTFKYGSSIQFYGTTEKLFIGHDKGVTKVDFAGTNETFVGTLGSYTQDVPRPSASFLGKLYFGNGNNILEIDTTENVVSYAKLSPGFPTGTYVRDIDVSPDGNYLQIIVSRINSPDLTSTTQDTTQLSSTDSYKFLWNETDTGYTSYESFNGYTLTSNCTFGPFSYTMGYDLGGAAIYTEGQKIVSLPTSISPNFGAMFSTGNLLGFASPDYDTENGILTASILVYGQYDNEIPKGLFRFFRYNKNIEVDLEPTQIPVCLVVSNLFYGTSAGYTNNQVGSAKLYFSAFGVVSSAFYRFTTVPTGSGTAIKGVYETQQEILSRKKFKITQVRLYTEPLSSGVDFDIRLIGPSGTLTGGDTEFIVGTNVDAGQDYVKFTPQTNAVHQIGVQINNYGDVNWTAIKCELDWEETGEI
jgi:hypothetical protein